MRTMIDNAHVATPFDIQVKATLMSRIIALSVLFISFTALAIDVDHISAQGGSFNPDAIARMIGANSGSGSPAFKPTNPKLGPLNNRRYGIDPVSIEIIDATFGPMREIEVIGGKQAVSEKQYAQLKLKVENRSTRMPVPYYSWAFHSIAPFSVKSEDGEKLPIWTPRKLDPKGAFTYPAGGVRVGGMLKSEASVVDIIAFELPANLKQNLFVELPGRNVNVGRPFVFKIPGAWFDKDAPVPKEPDKKKKKK